MLVKDLFEADHLDRKKPFTNAEFKALKRNADGDIVDMSTAFIWMTKGQIAQLSDDDSSRYHEHQEESAYDVAQARKEFGYT